MTWSYDAIAEVYATDMGQSMAFDDIGWYRGFCAQQRGAVLELGCGTGRILLELLAAGLDVSGADRSLPMLRRLRADAAARGLDARVLQTDLHALALRGRFATILLPYSLITYLTDVHVAAEILAGLQPLLVAQGCVVLDAFVPQPVESFSDFRLDYRRPHGDGLLERHKRITANTDGTNRIQRWYRVLGGDSQLREEFRTDETIRPYARTQLLALAAEAGYRVEREVHDYSDAAAGAPTRFLTLVLRR
ncbi:MAG: class I SAM-dependent methyltransferase [Rhodanobacteraceae bacterium]|nr:class I SAM-dependent methyltransferase [Rhodanobacteraceae bacterium]